MQGDFIVPVTIGRHSLADRDPRIFYQHLNIGAGSTVFATHKTFDGKSMVGCVAREDELRAVADLRDEGGAVWASVKATEIVRYPA